VLDAFKYRTAWIRLTGPKSESLNHCPPHPSVKTKSAGGAPPRCCISHIGIICTRDGLKSAVVAQQSGERPVELVDRSSFRTDERRERSTRAPNRLACERHRLRRDHEQAIR
jgi:hypothetical protein